MFDTWVSCMIWWLIVLKTHTKHSRSWIDLAVHNCGFVETKLWIYVYPVCKAFVQQYKYFVNVKWNAFCQKSFYREGWYTLIHSLRYSSWRWLSRRRICCEEERTRIMYHANEYRNEFVYFRWYDLIIIFARWSGGTVRVRLLIELGEVDGLDLYFSRAGQDNGRCPHDDRDKRSLHKWW